MRIAFSTVACPELCLERVCVLAEHHGYDGIELRTFGEDSSRFACDPALIDAGKLRGMLADAGIDAASVSTSLRFDRVPWPPVVGTIFTDLDEPVRRTKWTVALASAIECPFVRVFGFELASGESRGRGVRRIADRLRLGAAAARNTGVRLLVESGGSFRTAERLLELIRAAGGSAASSTMAPAYNIADAFDAGEDPVAGIEALGSALAFVRLKDHDADGRPCAPGAGVVPCDAVVRHLAAAGYRGWLSVEWDRAWFDGLEPAEAALPAAIRWIYERRGGNAAPAQRVSGAAVH